MPHSSGGGSHGGGSHHSSSHSSSHSRSGSGGRTRISKTRYPGSRRYVYYDKHNVAQYIYCSEDPAKTNKPRWILLIFYIPFIIAFVSVMASAVRVPIKLFNSDSDIYIEDNIGMIDDAAFLSAALSRFYNETGVTPAIMTVYDDMWKYDYSSLTTYAYNEYVIRFNDEKHWLIVYSMPRDSLSDSFIDWKWEGMIGDDTGGIIFQQVEDAFTDRMHKYLTATNRYTLGEAIASAFTDTLPDTKKVRVDWGSIAAGVFGLMFITFHGIAMIGLLPMQRRYAKAKPAPEPRELPVTCYYCNSTFILGDYTNCPNCGAELKAATASNLSGSSQTLGYPVK